MTDHEYSPISSLAVASGLLGCGGSLGLFAPEFALLALPGIATGLIAISEIRKLRLSGDRFAKAGIALSLFFALLTPVWHVTRFNSEALPGHERIDFSSLVTDDQNLDRLVGKNVCLKGYAIPGHLRAMNRFPLSMDGSTKKLEKIVGVELPAGTTWDWQVEAIAVSGSLVRVPTDQQIPYAPKCILRARVVRPSKTRIDLAQRAPWEGC